MTIEFRTRDDKTFARVLSRLDMLFLRLRTAAGERDIRLIDGSAERHGIGGIVFKPVNAVGAVTGPIEFLDYAQIHALGIY